MSNKPIGKFEVKVNGEWRVSLSTHNANPPEPKNFRRKHWHVPKGYESEWVENERSEIADRRETGRKFIMSTGCAINNVNEINHQTGRRSGPQDRRKS